MAVKKASAKKPAKKVVAKKAASKKTPAKKSAARSVAAKKAVAKKAPAKKAPAKKAPAKKALAKKAVLRFDIPEAPVVGRPNRLEVVSTPAPAPVLAPFAKSAPAKANGPSRRVIFALGIGVILLVAIVSSRAGNKSNDAAPAPTKSQSQSETMSAQPSMSPSETPSETSAMLSAHEAPGQVVANYVAGSAKAKAVITWSAPSATEGLTGYNVEISVAGGAWKVIATVPATALAQDISMASSDAWTSFKVSSVYSDSEVTSAKAFGLPGTWG